MRKMSEKTKKFLKDLDAFPEATINSLAKKHKIAAGYAYKLAKKQRHVDTQLALKRLAQAARPFETEVVTLNVNQPAPGLVKPATELEIAELLGLPANEVQVGGDHYRKNAIQPWDYITSNQLGYLEGNIVKYVSRWKDKGGRQDLEKAKNYLDKLLEVA